MANVNRGMTGHKPIAFAIEYLLKLAEILLKNSHKFNINSDPLIDINIF